MAKLKTGQAVVEDSGVTKWLISANDSFDTVRAFNELKTFDWNQGKYSLKEDDIVYIYLGKPVQKIRVKCKVVKANMEFSDIDDRKYITGITAAELARPFKIVKGNSMRLTILEEFVDSDLFGIKALHEHGINGDIRTPRRIKDEALAYISKIDVDKNVLRHFDKGKVITNKNAFDNSATLIQDNQIESKEILGAEREAVVKARINQSEFRQRLISRYKKCALCGMDIKELLVASHIKPWKYSTAKEKTSVENGLLLCPNHDKLFDQGYISFENNGEILISSLISKENYRLLGISAGMKIHLTKGNIPFIEYHRTKKHIW